MSRHLPSHPPRMGPVVDERSRLSRFGPHELALVLSHFDIGVIRSLKACSLGSRLSPKVKVMTAGGNYLLKRRAPGRNDPQRVAFAHSLQHQLQDWGFPVPRLIRIRDQDTSVLELDGHVYELFDFVEGERYDKSSAEAGHAGGTLGQLHRLLSGFHPRFRPPTGAYHAASEIDDRFEQLLPALVGAEPETNAATLTSIVKSLRAAYYEAAEKVEACGYSTWPSVIVHGDWHPGNLLFRNGVVVGVLDFDSARLEPRLSDIANGVLQFSILMGQAEDPLGWPDGFDPERLSAFAGSYRRACGSPLTPEELAALPWLIIEALVVESIVPIGATGRFAGICGSHFLRMVRRKIRWIRPRAEKLAEAAAG